ncbi:hypothetical protein [Vibrio penaeicida]|uniref:hypothetical protein n=1 Tax=Vibrio penaeicida TaxID=104609 RepID=UPI000F825006|nr:hypothetical protein [Vibrio penaeicida]RTZ20820.1 hypothetical protein EKN09_22515 [Vibrio penaeicida]
MKLGTCYEINALSTYFLPQGARFSGFLSIDWGLGFQVRHRFEDLVVLNQESVTQYENQANSPLGAYLLSQFIVKELGKDSSFHCVPDFEIERLELKQKIEL